MTPKAKQLLVAASPLLVFTATAFGLSALLGLRGADAWVLRGGLIALGGASSAVMYWFMRSLRGAGQAPTGAAPNSPERDIDATFAAARTQLSSARSTGTSGMAALPTILVLGPGASAKTTVVMRSGIEPELLAGGVMSGETIAPTTGVNLWFGRQALVLEAGGPVLTDSARWSRVLHHLKPSRLAALFRARAQAPRAAVVCIGCDRLLEAGGADASMTVARLLRERLAELSRTLGTRLPVYVIFTKMDRVPFFADWVRGFTRDDAREVLGATLPGDLTAPTGSYADRETARLNDAFEHIFRALAARRVDVLSREYDLEHRGAAYEFPREFRKLAAPVVSILVEMCRPSQLQVSPFLRGFYFTGVQAVLVSDVAPTPAPAASRAASASARGIGATNVFEQPARAAAPLQPPALTPSAPGVRKVPRWVFLDRLFTDVVLGDGPALDVTRGGAGAEQVRRIGLAAAAALGLFFTLGLLVSFIGNRRLESRTLAEARAVAALPTAQLDLPSADQLRRLDALRGRLETLAGWDRDGAPMRLGFGLYAGSSLIESASRIWFDGFERVMFGETRGALLSGIRAFPDTVRPTDDYAQYYDLLKAYLITSAHPDQSDPAFLTPVLMRQWLGGRELDAERTELSGRQFDHFGAALPIARPFADSADATAVERAREYLLMFADIAPIYRSMIADASSRHPGVQLHRLMPAAAGLVSNSYEVPGAFTRDGWTAMQGALANVDRYYQAESWVLGEAPDLPSDRAKLAADLRARYVAQYIAEWRAFLAAGSITRYADLRDAARKLALASANQSPLLGMLAVAARHTTVDSSIAVAFQPVHLVTPPTLEGSYLADDNRPYVDALIGLQSAVSQTAASTAGTTDQAASQASSAAASARVAARTLAQGFAPGGDAAAGVAVLRLLEEPIARVEPLLARTGTGEIILLGRSFCTGVRSLLGKVPFSPRSQSRASVEEVTRFFRPVSGDLWRFYDNALSRVVERQNGRWVAKPAGTTSVSPAFLSFFESATAFSDAFFRDGASELRFTFDVTPLTNDTTPLVAITMDGQEAISGSNVVQQRMVWTANLAQDARLDATIGGARTTLLRFEGPWAIFQLFQAGTFTRRAGGEYHVQWNFPGRGPGGATVTVAAELGLGGLAVFQRDFFSGFTCSGDIVR